jgi:hypothetical protein
MGDAHKNIATGDEKEVFYCEGATALFLAIEETEWRDALDIAEACPEQVRTWVRSTGTENTTFEWSMWRRLPIHEVSWILIHLRIPYHNVNTVAKSELSRLLVCFLRSGM